MIFAAHRLRTYAVFDFVILFRAKPRPSKKARLDKVAEEDAVLEPGKTPDLEAAIPKDIPNDPPQQDDDLIAEERPTNASGPINQPTGSIRIERSTGPAKPTDKPTALMQTSDTQEVPVMTTSSSLVPSVCTGVVGLSVGFAGQVELSIRMEPVG